MGRNDLEFHRCPDGVDARRSFTTVHDTTRREANHIQILRPSELPGQNAGGAVLRWYHVDIVRADHHDHSGSSLVTGLVRKFSDFRQNLPVLDNAWNKIGLTHKIRDERSGGHVIDRLRGVELFEMT